MTTHLIIPDAHAHPNYDNKRFTYLGKLIGRVKPDVVINIGDMADLPSLSSYDKGTKGFEGRRFQKDIDAVTEAQELMFAAMPKKKKRPRFVMCLGNHEDRITRAINASSELEGLRGFSLKALEYETFGWEVVPFRKSIQINGISYCHYFPSGIKGLPISGEHIGSSMCNKLHMSAVQGHSHLFNTTERTRPDGQKIFGLSVGCYVHPKYRETWCMAQEPMWWRGIVILSHLDNHGYYDILEAITLRRLTAEFG